MEKYLATLTFIGSELLIRDILRDEKYQNPKRLEKYGFKGNAQMDECGYIQEIFKRIGTTNKVMIEFGVGGKENENNTWYLVKNGWSGLWLDARKPSVEHLSKIFAGPISTGRLKIVEALITPKNVNKLFQKNGITGEIDLISIDIDTIDYWVWEAITVVNPRVVVIEYNAKYAPPMEWILPNNDDAKFNKNDCMGASLKSLEKLGTKKGYSLVGCGLSGANAYFVRNDLLGDKFAEPYSAENHYHPPRYYICKKVPGSNYGYCGMNDSYCSYVGPEGKFFK